MDLSESTEKQLQTLTEWLRITALQETPSPVIWMQIQKGMRDRAQFLETFVIPELEPSKSPFQQMASLPSRPKIIIPSDSELEKEFEEHKKQDAEMAR